MHQPSHMVFMFVHDSVRHWMLRYLGKVRYLFWCNDAWLYTAFGADIFHWREDIMLFSGDHVAVCAMM